MLQTDVLTTITTSPVILIALSLPSTRRVKDSNLRLLRGHHLSRMSAYRSRNSPILHGRHRSRTHRLSPGMSVFKTDWCPRTATFQLSSTASPGFEPELEESKSPVLPLDHKAISHRSEGNRTPICGSKVHHDRHYTTLPNCCCTGNERIRTSATRDTISHATATIHSRFIAVSSFI